MEAAGPPCMMRRPSCLPAAGPRAPSACCTPPPPLRLLGRALRTRPLETAFPSGERYGRRLSAARGRPCPPSVDCLALASGEPSVVRPLPGFVATQRRPPTLRSEALVRVAPPPPRLAVSTTFVCAALLPLGGAACRLRLPGRGHRRCTCCHAANATPETWRRPAALAKPVSSRPALLQAVAALAAFACALPARADDSSALVGLAQTGIGALDAAATCVDLYQALLVLFFLSVAAQALVELAGGALRGISLYPLGRPLARLLEPFLSIFRGVLPEVGGVDISPVLSFVALYILKSAVLTTEVIMLAYLYNQI